MAVFFFFFEGKPCVLLCGRRHHISPVVTAFGGAVGGGRVVRSGTGNGCFCPGRSPIDTDECSGYEDFRFHTPELVAGSNFQTRRGRI